MGTYFSQEFYIELNDKNIKSTLDLLFKTHTKYSKSFLHFFTEVL